MNKVICDFCGEEITGRGNKVVIEISTEVFLMGIPSDEEKHLHIECYTRVKNMLSHCLEKGIER